MMVILVTGGLIGHTGHREDMNEAQRPTHPNFDNWGEEGKTEVFTEVK